MCIYVFRGARTIALWLSAFIVLMVLSSCGSTTTTPNSNPDLSPEAKYPMQTLEGLNIDLAVTGAEQFYAFELEPQGARSIHLKLRVTGADNANEAALYVNNNGPLKLFAKQFSKDAGSSQISWYLASEWFKSGSNELRFVQASGDGFAITQGSVQLSDDVAEEMIMLDTEPEPGLEPSPSPEPTPTPSPEPSPAPVAAEFPLVLSNNADLRTNLRVEKPVNATDVVLILNVLDPDNAAEGELYINGNGPIILFEALLSEATQGSGNNDGKTLDISLETPLSWWKQGENSLRFKHLVTAGFTVNSAKLDFTVPAPAPSPEPTPAPSPAPVPSPSPEPSPTPDANFPLVLTNNADLTTSLTVSKPQNSSKALLTLNVFDPDNQNEGELYINDNGPYMLFGDLGEGSNDETLDITLELPVAWWKEGKNSLRFRHIATGGYTVNSVKLSFATTSPVPSPSPEPSPSPAPAPAPVPSPAPSGLGMWDTQLNFEPITRPSVRVQDLGLAPWQTVTRNDITYMGLPRIDANGSSSPYPKSNRMYESRDGKTVLALRMYPFTIIDVLNRTEKTLNINVSLREAMFLYESPKILASTKDTRIIEIDLDGRYELIYDFRGFDGRNTDQVTIGSFEGSQSYDDRVIPVVLQQGNDHVAVLLNRETKRIISFQRRVNGWSEVGTTAIDWFNTDPTGQYGIYNLKNWLAFSRTNDKKYLRPIVSFNQSLNQELNTLLSVGEHADFFIFQGKPFMISQTAKLVDVTTGASSNVPNIGWGHLGGRTKVDGVYLFDSKNYYVELRTAYDHSKSIPIAQHNVESQYSIASPSGKYGMISYMKNGGLETVIWTLGPRWVK